MSAVPLSILSKIKKLLSLARSPNSNEAEAARLKAEELLAKYNLTEADLAILDEKEYYGEDEKLFVTIEIVGWKRILSLAIATYFDCQIVQEQTVALGDETNISTYSYFVYGEDDQVRDTQFVWNAFIKKIDHLVSTRCLGRGTIHIESYCDGLVEAIKNNIQMYGLDLPEIKRTLKKEEVAIPLTSQSLTVFSNKEEPTDKRVSVGVGHIIKDIMAFFRGLEDGKNLSLQDILELEIKNNEAAQFLK